MAQIIEAVYENGVIRPLEKIIGQEGAVLLIEIRKVKGIFTREEIESIKK